jgi:hypothetical protein
MAGMRSTSRGCRTCVTQYHEVSEDYFETMGIRLVRGRVFTEADSEQATGVVGINETLARQYFGDTRWARSSRFASIRAARVE